MRMFDSYNLAEKSFTTKNPQTIPPKEASTNRLDTLQFYLSPSTVSPSSDSIQFGLQNSVIKERGCTHFERKLPFEIRECLKGLIGRQDTDIYTKQVHESNQEPPSGFRGVFIRYFFKKVIYNLKNENGRYEYAENFATIFPFQVLKKVPVRYDIEIIELFDEDFYTQIQNFLNDHFENADARESTNLFLANVNHFKATEFSEEALVTRVLQNIPDSNKSHGQNYLNSFPRLNHDGVDWFKELYRHYKNVRNIFDNVDVSLHTYDDNYFQTLPEANFADLYELLNTQLYKFRPKQYIERFKKYLFFFVHASKENTNPVFFIDDLLFECLKSLHRFKTSRNDLTMKKELAMLSLVHLRTQQKLEYYKDSKYRIEPEILHNIKTYVEKIPNIRNAQVDVEYKTDYLHGWMLLRNHDTCYDLCNSRRERKRVDEFVNRILCSVLAPDDQPIKYVVIYNTCKGQETRLKMPKNIETIRNFVRSLNKYDFANDIQAESNDKFLTRDLEMYFDHLTVADDEIPKAKAM